MRERRTNQIIVIAVLVFVIAATVGVLVWYHDESQPPKGQDSMDSIAIPRD